MQDPEVQVVSLVVNDSPALLDILWIDLTSGFPLEM